MRLVVALLLCAVTGCGRLSFDARSDAARDDSVADALDAPPGLIAWLPLDTLTTTTPDISGHAHHATCAGASCPLSIAGHRGGGMRFDGVDDELRIAGTSDLQTSAGFTIVVWLRVAAFPTTMRACLAQKMLGTMTFDSWELCVETDGRLFFYSASDTVDLSITSVGPYQLDRWHQITIVWDGNMKRMYEDDAILAGSSNQMISFDGNDVVLGRDYDGGSPLSEFAGDLDDFQIYDRALSVPEITQLASQ
ncbi:MAG TPA: LamG domain-containing protein [Kofleriaceae bacterium]|nr:LamG domain-containing protein [Kofleriaceae bacterium]